MRFTAGLSISECIGHTVFGWRSSVMTWCSRPPGNWLWEKRKKKYWAHVLHQHSSHLTVLSSSFPNTSLLGSWQRKESPLNKRSIEIISTWSWFIFMPDILCIACKLKRYSLPCASQVDIEQSCAAVSTASFNPLFCFCAFKKNKTKQKTEWVLVLGKYSLIRTPCFSQCYCFI